MSRLAARSPERWKPALHFALAVALWLVAACGSGSQKPAVRTAEAPPVAAFDFVATDGSHLSNDRLRGRVTVVVFVTTYDLNSQIAVRELSEVFHHAKPRINAFGVVMEPPKNAALAETFASALELPFPVALADAATLESRGPFGTLRGVPTFVVLDAAGHSSGRIEGAVAKDVIEAAVDAARHSPAR